MFELAGRFLLMEDYQNAPSCNTKNHQSSPRSAIVSSRRSMQHLVLLRHLENLCCILGIEKSNTYNVGESLGRGVHGGCETGLADATGVRGGSDVRGESPLYWRDLQNDCSTIATTNPPHPGQNCCHLSRLAMAAILTWALFYGPLYKWVQ